MWDSVYISSEQMLVTKIKLKAAFVSFSRIVGFTVFNSPRAQTFSTLTLIQVFKPRGFKRLTFVAICVTSKQTLIMYFFNLSK